MSIYKGDKLVAGKVYEETTIMPFAINSNFTGGDIGFTKNGKNVTLTFPNINAVSDTGSTLIAKLPLGVRPTINCYFTLWGFANNENINANKHMNTINLFFIFSPFCVFFA